MKLRLRSLETKETHKIQIPDSSSLQDLKLTLIQTIIPISNSNSNQIQNPSIEHLHLSLNRKDELQSEQESTPLPSLGITNGDLIFFTLNSTAFNSSFQESVMPKSVIEKSSNLAPESSLSQENKDAQKDKNMEIDQNLNLGEEEEVLDGDDIVEVDVGPVAKSFSVPGFLRKVFSEELGDESGRDHKLFVIAIHAVLLDSGFVAYDDVDKKEITGFPFRKEWPLGLFNLRLFYSLPEIVNVAGTESVSLKFHTLGNIVTVYGSLVNGSKSAVYRVSFDEEKLVPFLNVVWANCGLKEEISFGGKGSGTNAEKEVFEFWRRVKDEFALPMLIDLSEKCGFGLPACFMRLPTEIKLMILEAIPGVDVARAGCACSELRYLSSSDDLWKKKFAEEFGITAAARAGDKGHWKKKFVTSWETFRKRRRVSGRYSVGRIASPRLPSIDIWPHAPIIGGDYDLLPQPFGPLRLPLAGEPPITRQRLPNQVPRCDLSTRHDL